MAWNKLIRKGIPLAFVLLTLLSCTISYRFNGASINYDKVKNHHPEQLREPCPLSVRSVGTVVQQQVAGRLCQQTKLQFVKRGGDLELSGEITGYDVYNKAVAATAILPRWSCA